jgi:hypothetical protein
MLKSEERVAWSGKANHLVYSTVGPLHRAWRRSLSLCCSRGKGANSIMSALFSPVAGLPVKLSTFTICDTVVIPF